MEVVKFAVSQNFRDTVDILTSNTLLYATFKLPAIPSPATRCHGWVFHKANKSHFAMSKGLSWETSLSQPQTHTHKHTQSNIHMHHRWLDTCSAVLVWKWPQHVLWRWLPPAEWDHLKGGSEAIVQDPVTTEPDPAPVLRSGSRTGLG